MYRIDPINSEENSNTDSEHIFIQSLLSSTSMSALFSLLNVIMATQNAKRTIQIFTRIHFFEDMKYDLR